MAHRPDLRVAVQGAETHGDPLAFGPLAAEQARAAHGAERLDRAARVVDADQLLALEQAELLARDVSDREPESARVLAAARAVTVDRAREGQRHLELDAPTEAAAADVSAMDASLRRLQGCGER